MCIEKIKLIFAKHSIIVALLIILLVLFVVGRLNLVVDVFRVLEDFSETEFAVCGTLLGAFVGGAFTLVGTNFVNKGQLKAQTHIKRKNLIYKPLYDELIVIQNDFLLQNPYPKYIEFNKNKNTHSRVSLQYTVWERIKLDTRYLEVPESLKKEMKILYKLIEDYLVSINDVNIIITEILNTTLRNELSTECTIKNIGQVLSSQVLTNSNWDLFRDLDGCLNPSISIDEDERKRVSSIFYEKCKQNEKIQTIKKARTKWLEEQGRVLELLTTLITFVNIKYEG